MAEQMRTRTLLVLATSYLLAASTGLLALSPRIEMELNVTETVYGEEFLSFNTSELPTVGDRFIFTITTDDSDLSDSRFVDFFGYTLTSIPITEVQLEVAGAGPTDAFKEIADDWNNTPGNRSGKINYTVDEAGNIEIETDISVSSAGPFFSADTFNTEASGLTSTVPASRFALGDLNPSDVTSQIGSSVSGSMFFFAGGLDFELQGRIRADLAALRFVGFRQALTGDFDGDGAINEGDYDAWVTSYGLSGDVAADANGDDVVNAADYTVWRDAVGTAAAVPEPTTLATLLLASAFARLMRPRLLD